MFGHLYHTGNGQRQAGGFCRAARWLIIGMKMIQQAINPSGLSAQLRLVGRGGGGNVFHVGVFCGFRASRYRSDCFE